MQVGCVTNPDWGAVRHLLLPALEWAGEFTEEEVQSDLDSKKAQLWIAADDEIRCAAVTRISPRPGGKICEIWLLGGTDMDRWLDCLNVIEAAAKDHGCVGMSFIGRPGWERLLPGYRRSAVVMKKAFEDGR